MLVGLETELRDEAQPANETQRILGEAQRRDRPQDPPVEVVTASVGIDERTVGEESQIPRYTAARSPDSKGRTLIFATDPGQFGMGIVGSASDPALATQIAKLLNRLDPASYKAKNPEHRVVVAPA